MERRLAIDIVIFELDVRLVSVGMAHVRHGAPFPASHTFNKTDETGQDRSNKAVWQQGETCSSSSSSSSSPRCNPIQSNPSRDELEFGSSSAQPSPAAPPQLRRPTRTRKAPACVRALCPPVFRLSHAHTHTHKRTHAHVTITSAAPERDGANSIIAPPAARWLAWGELRRLGR